MEAGRKKTKARFLFFDVLLFLLGCPAGASSEERDKKRKDFLVPALPLGFSVSLGRSSFREPKKVSCSVRIFY